MSIIRPSVSPEWLASILLREGAVWSIADYLRQEDWHRRVNSCTPLLDAKLLLTISDYTRPEASAGVLVDLMLNHNASPDLQNAMFRAIQQVDMHVLLRDQIAGFYRLPVSRQGRSSSIFREDITYRQLIRTLRHVSWGIANRFNSERTSMYCRLPERHDDNTRTEILHRLVVYCPSDQSDITGWRSLGTRVIELLQDCGRGWILHASSHRPPTLTFREVRNADISYADYIHHLNRIGRQLVDNTTTLRPWPTRSDEIYEFLEDNEWHPTLIKDYVRQVKLLGADILLAPKFRASTLPDVNRSPIAPEFSNVELDYMSFSDIHLQSMETPSIEPDLNATLGCDMGNCVSVSAGLGVVVRAPPAGNPGVTSANGFLHHVLQIGGIDLLPDQPPALRPIIRPGEFEAHMEGEQLLAPDAVPLTQKVDPTTELDDVDQKGASTDVGQCVICMNVPHDCVFIPCGHLSCCFACGTRVYHEKRVCPLCREPINMAMRVYIN